MHRKVGRARKRSAPWNRARSQPVWRRGHGSLFRWGGRLRPTCRLWNWEALTLCRFGFFRMKSREEATSTFFPTTATRFGAYARVTCSNTCSEESKVRQCKGMPGRTWFWSGTALSHAYTKTVIWTPRPRCPRTTTLSRLIGAHLPTAEALDDREPFHGMIDDLIVWDRALTSSEVSLLHEFESDLHEPYPNDEDGLVPFVVTEFHKAGSNGEYEFEAGF